MSFRTGRMLGASIRYSTTGDGPSCSGWKTNVFIVPSAVVMSISVSIICAVSHIGLLAVAAASPHSTGLPLCVVGRSNRPPSGGDQPHIGEGETQPLERPDSGSTKAVNNKHPPTMTPNVAVQD